MQFENRGCQIIGTYLRNNMVKMALNVNIDPMWHFKVQNYQIDCGKILSGAYIEYYLFYLQPNKWLKMFSTYPNKIIEDLLTKSEKNEKKRKN